MNGRERLRNNYLKMRKEWDKEMGRDLASRRAASHIRDKEYQRLEVMLVEVTNMMKSNDSLTVGDYNALNGIKNAITQAVGCV